MAVRQEVLEIAGNRIRPGERRTLHLDLARLYTHTRLDLDLEVIHGRRPGPVLLVSATIHGDELNGVEICRQLLKHKALSRIRGTLIVVPVVNIFGFIHRSRYLPDRRDLNRCFPGSEKGSLGSRVAYLFRTQVLAHCSHAIDLHTGAMHRSNLPQIRANLASPDAESMARAFGAPVILDSKIRDGSMRECADEMGIPLILYEAGEALRFEDSAIRGGVRGVLRVMRYLEMLPPSKSKRPVLDPVTAHSSAWVRADFDGIFRPLIRLGQRVNRGQMMGLVASPFGNAEEAIIAPHSGILIGRTNIPLVNEGDALFHIARFGTVTHHAQRRVEAISEEIDAHRLADDLWNPTDT